MNLYWEDLHQGMARLQFLVRSNKLLFHKINLDSDQREIRNANIKIQGFFFLWLMRMNVAIIADAGYLFYL